MAILRSISAILIFLSYLNFIKRYPLSEEDDAIVYCSSATEDEKDFSSIEKTIINMMVSGSVTNLIERIIKQ